MKKKTIEIIQKPDDDLTAFYCWGLEKEIRDKILMMLNGLDIEVKQSEVPGLMSITPPFDEKVLENEIKDGNTVPVNDKAQSGAQGFVLPNTLTSLDTQTAMKDDEKELAQAVDPAVTELSGYGKKKDLQNVKVWASKYAITEDISFVKDCLLVCCNNVFKAALTKYLAQRGIYDSRQKFEDKKYQEAVKTALSGEMSEQLKEDLLTIYRLSLKPFMMK